MKVSTLPPQQSFCPYRAPSWRVRRRILPCFGKSGNTGRSPGQQPKTGAVTARINKTLQLLTARKCSHWRQSQATGASGQPGPLPTVVSPAKGQLKEAHRRQ